MDRSNGTSPEDAIPEDSTYSPILHEDERNKPPAFKKLSVDVSNLTAHGDYSPVVGSGLRHRCDCSSPWVSAVLRPQTPLFGNCKLFVPEEICLEILGWLEPFEIARMCYVSRNWSRLASDNILWKHICLERFYEALSCPNIHQICLTSEWKSNFVKLRGIQLRVPTEFAGDANCAAISNEGHLYAWGSGIGTHPVRLHPYDFGRGCVSRLESVQFSQVSCGSNMLAAISKNGQFFCGPCTSFRPYLKGTKVIACSAGDNVAFCCCSNGEVYGFGNGLYRAFLNEPVADRPFVYQIPGDILPPCVDCACSYKHAFFITVTGVVYGMGQHAYNVLGSSDSPPRNRPHIISDLRNLDIIQISAGHCHSACVTRNGELYSWGYSGNGGQKGIPSSSSGDPPSLVKHFVDIGRRVLMVSCGYSHTCVVTDDRNLYTFGYGPFGRLGHGNYESVSIPKRVEYFASHNIRIAYVSGGSQHTVAVSEDGRVWSWGNADSGRLGHGNVISTRSLSTPRPIHDLSVGRTFLLDRTAVPVPPPPPRRRTPLINEKNGNRPSPRSVSPASRTFRSINEERFRRDIFGRRPSGGAPIA